MRVRYPLLLVALAAAIAAVVVFRFLEGPSGGHAVPLNADGGPPNPDAISGSRPGEKGASARTAAPKVEDLTEASIAELAARFRAQKTGEDMFRDLSREKADAVRLEVGRDVYGILDSREFEDEFKRLSTALAPALLPTSQKPLSLLDRQILERMARDYEAQIAERAQKSMDLLQHDLVAKWNARQGLTTWHDGDPVPPSAEQDNTGQFRRGMAGMIGGGLNFRFGYSSQASPEVENSFLGVADLKQQLLEAQLAYLKSR